METEQVKKNTEILIEQFSRQKIEDPLIKYWIERKRGIVISSIDPKKSKHTKKQ
jgi:hypothetical protein